MAPRRRRSQAVVHPPPDHTVRTSDENLSLISLSTDGGTNVPSVINSIEPKAGRNSE